MLMKPYLIISPYSKKLLGKDFSPKDYPHWIELIESLNNHFTTVQIGEIKEKELNCNELILGASFEELVKLTEGKNWLSVDSFLPHLINSTHKTSGVVIFGISDPEIFGYGYNMNVIKGHQFIKKNKFEFYSEKDVNLDAWLKPNILSKIILKHFKIN